MHGGAAKTTADDEAADGKLAPVAEGAQEPGFMPAGGGFAPVGRLTLQEQVYQALRLTLMVGAVVPGQGLTVRELAQSMGTSPMPVREAMRRLIAERALELLPNGTVRVRLMSEAQRAESREIRILLECLAIARAAQLITPQEIVEAEQQDAEMVRALHEERFEDYIAANQRFHFLCYRAARSQALFDIIEGLWVQNGPFLRLYAQDTMKRRRELDYADLYQHHTAILRAFRAHDGEAAAEALARDLGRTSATRESAQPEDVLFTLQAVRRHSSRGKAQKAEAGGQRRTRRSAEAAGGQAAAPAAVHRATLQEQVYRAIRRALIMGDMVPGQVVTVRSFAERMGTSPMPVREALRRLVAERAFEPLPNGSLRVRLLDSTELRHIREIRALLEGLAVARATERISAEELGEAQRLSEAMKAALKRSDLKSASLANQEFHFLLYRASRSEVLYEIIERLWVQSGPFLMMHMIELMRHAPAGQQNELTSHHDRLLAALLRRDSAAAADALVADLMQTATAREDPDAGLLQHLARPAKRGGRGLPPAPEADQS